jgi:hypothetical protein
MFNGKIQRMLDLVPSNIHDRCPVILGAHAPTLPRPSALAQRSDSSTHAPWHLDVPIHTSRLVASGSAPRSSSVRAPVLPPGPRELAYGVYVLVTTAAITHSHIHPHALGASSIPDASDRYPVVLGAHTYTKLALPQRLWQQHARAFDCDQRKRALPRPCPRSESNFAPLPPPLGCRLIP